MKFIIDAEPEDAPAVLARMIEMIPRFAGRSRPGWGWHGSVAGKTYFIRETKTGLSASRARSEVAPFSPAPGIVDRIDYE